MPPPDLIHLIETAYDLQSSDRQWMANVVEAAAPHLDVGRGVFGFYFDASDPQHVRVWHPVDVGDTTIPMKMRLARNVIAGRDTAGVAWVSTGLTTVGSLSDVLRQRPGFAERARPWLALSGHRDYLGIRACDAALRGVAIVACHPEVFTAPSNVCRRWSRLAAHIAAGHRLRRSLQIADLDPLLDDGEAVLSPDGRVHHAVCGATESDARDRLARAVVSIDRARGKARSGDTEFAVSLWRGLVDGTWSLVERFESDGRRYLIARRNEPGTLDPRGLTLREKQVLSFAALGHASKLIAYELGLRKSTVTTHLSSAKRKLGIETQVTLVRLLQALEAPSPERGIPMSQSRDDDEIRAFLVRLSGEDLAVLSIPAAPELPGSLTPAERRVGALVLAGSSNREIARHRGCSARTVANQIASIFRKTKVSSRAELTALVARMAETRRDSAK